MSENLANAFKVIAVILFLLALGIGAWFIYSNFINKTANNQNEKIKITWWGIWEDEADMKVIIDKYVAENQNIEIEYVQRDAEGYKNTTLGRLTAQGSEAPDIITIHNTWLYQFEDQLTPLPSSIMSENDYKNTFYDTALNDFKGSSGGIYAMPMMFDGLGLYYNKKLLEAQGYTDGPADNWVELRQQAKQLTTYDTSGKIVVAGISMGTTSKVQFSADIVNLLMLQQGADPIVNGKWSTDEDSNKAIERAINFYVSFSKTDKVWDASLDSDIQMFAEGRLAMMFAPSWRVHDIMVANNPELDFDVAPVPQLADISNEKVYLSTYWAEAVTKNSQNSAEAWKFLKFVTEQEQLKALFEQVDIPEYRQFGQIYPRRDMESELADKQYTGAFITMAKEGARSWNMKDSDKMNQAINDLVDKVISGNASALDQEILNIGEQYDAISKSGN